MTSRIVVVVADGTVMGASIVGAWPIRTNASVMPGGGCRSDHGNPVWAGSSVYVDRSRLDSTGVAGTRGGTLPAVLNAANEVAVEAFCQRQLSFLGITQTVRQVMQDHQLIEHPSLDQILAADHWARVHASSLIRS